MHNYHGTSPCQVVAHFNVRFLYNFAGTIKEDINDGSFIVEDSAGDLERIWREDVIRDADDTNCTIHVRIYIEHYNIGWKLIIFATVFVVISFLGISLYCSLLARRRGDRSASNVQFQLRTWSNPRSRI